MERIVAPKNLRAALRRVRKNQGAPGVDGMTVSELGAHLRANWPTIREQLLAGAYEPARGPLPRDWRKKGAASACWAFRRC